jgi:BirA family transcriptional regulator, biotin operon repressor / biotin---[acetyl-CoA-carboxylase] ligase
VAGILAESSEGRVVLGVGINVNQTLEQLPENAQARPTSLRLEVGGPVDRARLLAAVLVRLEGAYDAWVSGTSAPG